MVKELPLHEQNKRKSTEVERSEIRPGDHIYTYRGGPCGVFYTHHGIYVGENKVVHYTAMRKEYSGIVSENARGELSCGNSDCGFHKPKSGVVLICLDCFLRHGSLHRYKYHVTLSFLLGNRAGTCTTVQSNPSERVVHCAEYLLQNGFGYYNVFRNNCEDFALYCKTELWILDWHKVGRSGQVWIANTRFLVDYVLILMLAPILRANFVRFAVDIGVREDVLLVAVEELPLNLGRGKMDAENTKKMRDLKNKIKGVRDAIDMNKETTKVRNWFLMHRIMNLASKYIPEIIGVQNMEMIASVFEGDSNEGKAGDNNEGKAHE